MEADALIATTVNQQHIWGQSSVYDGGADYIFVTYAKLIPGTTYKLRMKIDENSTSFAVFDLTALTFTLGGEALSATIIDVGNGWRKCTVVGTTQVTASRYCSYNIMDSAGIGNFPGDGVHGFYLWGASLIQVGESTEIIANPNELVNPVYALEVIVQLNVAEAPDVPADLATQTSAAATQFYVGWEPQFVKEAAKAYTFSVDVRANGTTKVRLSLSSNEFTGGTFDLVAVTAAGNNGATASIVALDGGWFRVSTTGQVGAGASFQLLNLLNAAGQDFYNGDGVSGVYLYGASYTDNDNPGVNLLSFPNELTTTLSSQVVLSLNVAEAPQSTFEFFFINGIGVRLAANGRANIQNNVPAIVPSAMSGREYENEEPNVAFLQCNTAGGAPFTWQNGLRYGTYGYLSVTFAIPIVPFYVNGFLVSEQGELVVAAATPIEGYNHGWPIDATGRLCINATGSVVPGAFTFSPPVVGPAIVDLTWTASAGAVLYQLYRDGVVFKNIPGGTLNSFDTPPGPGTYTYAVTAVNGNGTTLPTPPSYSGIVFPP
jgi:hypothetical protein